MVKSHLIIVPGHSIYNPRSHDSKGLNQSDWFLESFQKEGQDHLIFIKHIEKGIETLRASKDDSILIFSGGQTKKIAGPKSEAYGYYQLANDLRLIDQEIKSEIILEEFARDSFENVLFSISRFYEIVGSYPKFITIVGFEFKRFRFLELHLKTLNWNIENNVNYIGIDPKPPYLKDSNQYENYFQELNKSEKLFAIDLFQNDFLGNKETLRNKKISRNPFNRTHGYIQSNPQLAPFFGLELDESITTPWN